MAKLDSQVYYTTKFTNFEIALSQTPFDLPQNNGCAPLSQKNQILNNIILRIRAHPCIQLEMQ